MNEKLYNYLRETKKFTKQTAKEIVESFAEHPDIMQELITFIETGKYRIEGVTPLEVEGYTAQRIKTEFQFTGFECYDILLFLRKDPKKVFKLMERGFK